VSRRDPIKLLVRRQSRELFPDEQLSSIILASMKRGSSASVDTFVIERPNLLCDPFIQSRVHPCRWRLPEEMRFDGCLRAFSAKSRNMILTFLSP